MVEGLPATETTQHEKGNTMKTLGLLTLDDVKAAQPAWAALGELDCVKAFMEVEDGGQPAHNQTGD